MRQKMDVSRIAASAIAMGMVAGLATAAQAQEDEITLTCQYLIAVAGEGDVLTLEPPVTDPFTVPVFAVDGAIDLSQLKKATGPAVTDDLPAATFVPSEAMGSEVTVESGSFSAEVDAKLKDTETPDGLFSCAASALVKGVGQLQVSVLGEDELEPTPANWLIRSNSRLDGGNSTAILGTGEADVEDCPEDIDSPCSVHPVRASLKITAQGTRNNGDLKYDRFNIKKKDLIEVYLGAPPEQGDDLVLVCGCVDIPDEMSGESEDLVEP